MLHLIEKAELDITKLSLGAITEEYLNYINDMKTVGIENISSFLVVASKLIQIKSESLLPSIQDTQDDENDVGALLVQQLLLYKQYKNIALKLREIENKGGHTYLRLAPLENYQHKPDLEDITLNQLILVFQLILLTEISSDNIQEKIAIPKITLKNKLEYITRKLLRSKEVRFTELLSSQTNRIDIIVTFLAVLELIKQHIIEAQQKNIFGEIVIEKIREINENDTFELEFD